MKYLYHCSSEVGLEVFTPRPLDSYHDPSLKGEPVLYLTSNRQYASAFSFPWNDNLATLSSYDNETFTIFVDHSLKKVIESPREISIYTFEYNAGLMTPIKGNNTPEWIVRKPIKVIGEQRYKSAKECMSKNGLLVKYTKDLKSLNW